MDFKVLRHSIEKSEFSRFKLQSRKDDESLLFWIGLDWIALGLPPLYKFNW